ncbi:MAG: matrixin family metalloprotease [Gemmatimonadota bacterium]|nr:MAG: matrixin family metalloprotease [Gemmatimonadota bacterium]
MRRLAFPASLAVVGIVAYLVARAPDRVASDRGSIDTVLTDSAPQGGTVDWDSVRATRAAVRSRIAESDTYLPAMLAEGDSMLRRWPERVDRPIAVYLPDGGAPGYTVAMGQAVEDAFSRWQRSSSIPVHFRFVRDSAGAEVFVRWIDRFTARRTGQADLTWSSRGWLLRGTLTLATHSPSGWSLSADAVRTVAVHEIGHLLGLGHSDDPSDVMYPTTTVHDLTLRDQRTAGLLYALPPGSVRDPRPRR